MTYNIQYLPTMRQDIADIKAYLSQFYENTFPNFMAKLERNVKNLEDMPYIGVAYKDYRRLVVDDYLVFYKVDETMHTVQIFRVLHGAQDILNMQANLELLHEKET